jgi:uncharacterized repeat protein (TIGR03803 family)
MRTLAFIRVALSVSVAAALLSACGGSQLPASAPGAMPQSRAVAQVVRATPADSVSERVLYSFAGGNDGANPEGVSIVVHGELYGTTAFGGNGGCAFVQGCGTVYGLNTSGQERILYVFKGGSDGEAPNGSLAEDDGNLIGTTELGGSSGCKDAHVKGCGTVFEVTLTGKERILYRFPGKAQGALPVSGLTLFRGELYGEAAAGGGGAERCYYANVPGCGLIFKMRLSGSPEITDTFEGGKSGGTPQGTLLVYKGNLYGTTSAGGGRACVFSYGCGTAFEVAPSGARKTLHEFGRTLYAAALPESGLVLLNGTFYGTTFSGGTYDCAFSFSFLGCGTVFKLTPSGKFQRLYSFKGRSDGAYPNGLVAMNGNLYGTAGGAAPYEPYGCGTVFELTPSGHETTLYHFKGGSDGCGPTSALIYAGGTLYGTTGSGGKYSSGTVFAITP